MRLLIIILVCFMSFVVSRPQNSENHNGYQYNQSNNNINIDRLSNLGLTQKLSSSSSNIQNGINKNYIPPLSIQGQQNFNNNNLPLQSNSDIEITKSIGITSPQGDDNGIFHENRNILEQSGLLNGGNIQNNGNNNNNIVSSSSSLLGIENNIPSTINLGSTQQTQSEISFSTDNNYNHLISQQQQQPQYLSSYQNYAPNYNSNGIISQQHRDDIIEKNIYVHLPSSIEQYQQQLPQPQLPPRKHYKIIFVKAPNRPTPPPQPIQEIEEKTLVYVLVKKPELPNLDEIQAIQQQSIKSSKPEVYFIKYKTGQTEPGKIQSSLESELPQNVGDNSGGVIGGNNGSGLIKNSIDSGLTLTSATSINNDNKSNQQNQRLNDNRPHHLYDAPINKN